MEICLIAAAKEEEWEQAHKHGRKTSLIIKSKT